MEFYVCQQVCSRMNYKGMKTVCVWVLPSSFPVIHKVGNVDIFVLPEFEKYDR